jgi:hypothetical protein
MPEEAVELKPDISRIKSQYFHLLDVGLCPTAPPPHQRAFRFRLFVSATGSNKRKPLWKPSGKNT